jgi:hypothetical protein
VYSSFAISLSNRPRRAETASICERRHERPPITARPQGCAARRLLRLVRRDLPDRQAQTRRLDVLHSAEVRAE